MRATGVSFLAPTKVEIKTLKGENYDLVWKGHPLCHRKVKVLKILQSKVVCLQLKDMIMAGMAPAIVDPATAVKLWLKTADSEQRSEKWGRVPRAAWQVAWRRM